MGMTPRRLAALLVIAGVTLTLVGVALVSIPAALIAGGLVVAGLGAQELR